MCGRRPCCKRILAFGPRSGASHVSGLFARRMTAGPDGIRSPGPNQFDGLDARVRYRALPTYRSTVSHHAIMTLAICYSCQSAGNFDPLSACNVDPVTA